MMFVIMITLMIMLITTAVDFVMMTMMTKEVDDSYDDG